MVNKAFSILKIYMNGLDIGQLEKTKTGALYFSYSESWLNMPGARPVSLSLPLVAFRYSGEAVYNFFDNLLPDNPNIRTRIQAKFKARSNHPFDLLAHIGKDCIGALQIVSEERLKFQKKIEYLPASIKKIAYILRNNESAPLGMMDEAKDFRLSLAGVQEKAAFLYHDNRWCIPINQTPTTHIFKLPIGRIAHQQLDLSNSCENEWLCGQIAAAFGFKTAQSEIKYFEDIKVLIAERFDRMLADDKSWIIRLPQEDMCQALGYSSNLKYQSDGGPGVKEVMKFLLGAEDSSEARNTFFKAQILFWLLGAIDGHAKNFSIFIRPEGRFELTPLYDILSAYPMIADKQLSSRQIKMAMALLGKNVHYQWYYCKRSHFIDTAKHCGYSAKVAESLLDEMLSKVEDIINKVSLVLPADFNQQLAAAVFSGMLAMKKRLEKH